MRTDQIAELEMMLDDYGLERVLDTLADRLVANANWIGRHANSYDRSRSLRLQAAAIRALASKQVITGRTALEAADARD